jgi:3-hydroxyacyl-CoA dehydrogenase
MLMTTEIHTIAVIGAGDVGREMACCALLAGYRTILEDVSENRLEQAAVWIATGANVSAEARSRLVLVRKIEEAVREADLIIEAVAEEMEMKIEMFTIFDKFAKPNAILASTSRSVSIAELAEVTFCRERCIGIRFNSEDGSEDGRAKTLALVTTLETSEETLATCQEFGRRLGKSVTVLRDIGARRQDASATRASVTSR